MKYRVRIDAAFPNQADAETFMVQARTSIAKANSINEDKGNAEISFVDYHRCFHDESISKPCEKIERHEVRAGKVVDIKVSRNTR